MEEDTDYGFNPQLTSDMDLIILDQMPIQDLVRYCQTSEYTISLCSIPKIQRRINHYKSFLAFTPLDHIDVLDHYMLMDYKISFFNMQFYMLLMDGHEKQIHYYTQLDRMIVTHHPINQLNKYDMVDIGSLFKIYEHFGFAKYVKSVIAPYVKDIHDLLNRIPYDGEERFFYIFGLYLWFQLQAYTLNLIVEYTDHDINFRVTEAYLQSEDGVSMLQSLVNRIDYYYDLIKMYMDKWP
jgi:hypothetical protein